MQFIFHSQSNINLHHHISRWKNAVEYDLCNMISARILEMLCFLRWKHRRISQHLLNESKRCSLYRAHILFHIHKSLKRILDLECLRRCSDWLWNGGDSSWPLISTYCQKQISKQPYSKFTQLIHGLMLK